MKPLVAWGDSDGLRKPWNTHVWPSFPFLPSTSVWISHVAHSGWGPDADMLLMCDCVLREGFFQSLIAWNGFRPHTTDSTGWFNYSIWPAGSPATGSWKQCPDSWDDDSQWAHWLHHRQRRVKDQRNQVGDLSRGRESSSPFFLFSFTPPFYRPLPYISRIDFQSLMLFKGSLYFHENYSNILKLQFIMESWVVIFGWVKPVLSHFSSHNCEQS